METTLYQLASAVGGIGGLMAIVIFVQSRREAQQHMEAYEALVNSVVERMDRMLSEQAATMRGFTDCMHDLTENLSDHDHRTRRVAGHLVAHRHAMEGGPIVPANGDEL